MSPPRDTDSSSVQQPSFSQQASPLQSWLQARARLEPELLIKAPAWVRGVFDHAWAPMRALAAHTACLPAALCQFLLSLDTGFIAIHAAPSHYVPGSSMLRRRSVRNVAFVSVEDLALDNERPLHVIGHLIDHHLGCGGGPDAPWLTGGGGLNPDLKAAGARLPGLFALGYAVDEVAGSNVRDYFAESLALYCRDRQRLNTGDPQIYKWFRSTLWDQAFWQSPKS